MLIVALLLALLVGISLGLFGGGGSILTLPILRYVLGLEGHSAVATSLLVVGATSLAGLGAHAARGLVQWRTGLLFGAAAMVGAYLSGRLAHLLPAALLLAGFSVVMLATALAMLRPERRPRAPAPRIGRKPAALPVAKILVEGLVVGGVTGLVGAGGGFLVVPALVLLGRLPMQVAIGTSLLVIALKSFAGLAGYVGHTALDWPLALGMTAAAVGGSFGGAHLMLRVRGGSLRRGFGWFVIAMAFFILSREAPALIGRQTSPLLSVLVPLFGTLLVAGARRLVTRRRSGGLPQPTPISGSGTA